MKPLKIKGDKRVKWTCIIGLIFGYWLGLTGIESPDSPIRVWIGFFIFIICMMFVITDYDLR